MQKKLSRYGNSLALIIDKPILELLHINEDTMLQISTDGEKITIIPRKNPNEAPSKYKVSDDPKVQKAFEETMSEYAALFKKLAKN